jgi:hypothetical protein
VVIAVGRDSAREIVTRRDSVFWGLCCGVVVCSVGGASAWGRRSN